VRVFARADGTAGHNPRRELRPLAALGQHGSPCRLAAAGMTSNRSKAMTVPVSALFQGWGDALKAEAHLQKATARRRRPLTRRFSS